jgi:hypothetical protein
MSGRRDRPEQYHSGVAGNGGPQVSRTTAGPAQVALLAMEVGQSALGALRSVSAALDVQERLIAPRVQPKNAVEPVAPDTPQLLPAVAVFWGTLAASLKARC